MDCILISGTVNSCMDRYAVELLDSLPSKGNNKYIHADGNVDSVYNASFLLNPSIDRLIVATNMSCDEFFRFHKELKGMFKVFITMDDRTMHFYTYNLHSDDFVPHSWIYNLYSNYMKDSFDKGTMPVKLSFISSILHSLGSVFEAAVPSALDSDFTPDNDTEF